MRESKEEVTMPGKSLLRAEKIMSDDVREPSRQPVRFLVFSASLRQGSLNTQQAELAATVIEANGGSVDLEPIRLFDAPAYDEDIQRDEGFPSRAEEFRRRIEGADALVISSPEYNSSMPGLLKNAIDWVSRYRPQPFNERHGLLMSASPSMAGGNRGLRALRIPLEHLGARIYPDMFSLAQAHKGLTSEGRIADEQLQDRFDTNIVNFMDQVEASTHYPCIKKAWVEYLGEHPEPAIDQWNDPRTSGRLGVTSAEDRRMCRTFTSTLGTSLRRSTSSGAHHARGGRPACVLPVGLVVEAGPVVPVRSRRVRLRAASYVSGRRRRRPACPRRTAPSHA
jgi:chromate reductase